MKQKELIQKHVDAGGMHERDHKEETINKHLILKWLYSLAL